MMDKRTAWWLVVLAAVICATPSRAAVTYDVTFNFGGSNTGTTDAFFTFSSTLSDFLPLGGTLTYAIGDITPAPSLYPDSLVLTQAPGSIGADLMSVSFDPGLGFFPITRFDTTLMQPNTCFLGLACDETRPAVANLFFAGSETVSDSAGGTYHIVVSGTGTPVDGQVPEPTSLILLATTGLAGMAMHLRRRAVRVAKR